MQYFDAVILRPELAAEDRAQFPPGLLALAVRGAGPEGKPDAGLVLFEDATEDDFARILEAIWLDRRLDAKPSVQRKLYLVGGEIYLQVGGPDNVRKVGERGPIRGAVEGFRGILRSILADLATAPLERVPTPIGERLARHIVKRLPDPGGEGVR